MAVNQDVQALFNTPNKIYKITRDITLKAGETIKFPPGITLDFQGGIFLATDENSYTSDSPINIIGSYNTLFLGLYYQGLFSFDNLGTCYIRSGKNLIRFKKNSDQFFQIESSENENSNKVFKNVLYTGNSKNAALFIMDENNRRIADLTINSDNTLGINKIRQDDNYIYLFIDNSSTRIKIRKLWAYDTVRQGWVTVLASGDSARMPSGLQDFTNITVYNEDNTYQNNKDNTVITPNYRYPHTVYEINGNVTLYPLQNIVKIRNYYELVVFNTGTAAATVSLPAVVDGFTVKPLMPFPLSIPNGQAKTIKIIYYRVGNTAYITY